MKAAAFIRKGKVITDVKSGKHTVYASFNKAKKESRAIQIKLDGALGRGSVRVER